MNAKFFSGRWLLTVMIGITYVYCALTQLLEAKDVVVITLIVVKEYFDRKDRREESDSNDGNAGS